MNDTELMELAAKAAGYTLVDGVDLWKDGALYLENWNPLEDQAQAYVLAQEAGLTVVIEGNSVQVYWNLNDGDFWIDADGNDDLPGVTRRTIVRAAAEIGKSKP